jgi:monoamine oxidase
MSRRGLLAAAAGGAAATTGVALAVTGTSSSPNPKSKHSAKQDPHSKKPRRSYEVVVVGAGLAGLCAAAAIKAAGHSVLVLEARNRVGGRTYDVVLSPGAVLEMGGEWTGPGQTKVQALAARLGVKLFDAYSQGENLYYRDGHLLTYGGDIPPASSTALVQLEQVIEDLNMMAKGLPGTQPWAFKQAGEYDAQSVGSWIDARNMTEEATFLSGLAVRSIYGEEASQISLMDLLGEIWGVGGDLNTAIGSAQSMRFVGGPQQLSVEMAKQLGSSIKLKSPVFLIRRGKSPTAHVGSESYEAKQIIVAVPKSVTAAIRFEPALPPAYSQYFQRQPTGATVKVQAVYDSPFWRHSGLSGSVVSDTGPIEVVYDNSPPSGSPGVLVGFAEGDQGRSLFGLSSTERKSLVVANLVKYFGPSATTPSAYHDLVWAHEVYSGGAYGSFNPPGVITSLGNSVAGPLDNIRFAGADYSAYWPGYMEGAVLTGQGAADQALDALAHPS